MMPSAISKIAIMTTIRRSTRLSCSELPPAAACGSSAARGVTIAVVGERVGDAEGAKVGVGLGMGFNVGRGVGIGSGTAVGLGSGAKDGAGFGADVGANVLTRTLSTVADSIADRERRSLSPLACLWITAVKAAASESAPLQFLAPSRSPI